MDQSIQWLGNCSAGQVFLSVTRADRLCLPPTRLSSGHKVEYVFRFFLHTGHRNTSFTQLQFRVAWNVLLLTSFFGECASFLQQVCCRHLLLSRWQHLHRSLGTYRMHHVVTTDPGKCLSLRIGMKTTRTGSVCFGLMQVANSDRCWHKESLSCQYSALQVDAL